MHCALPQTSIYFAIATGSELGKTREAGTVPGPRLSTKTHFYPVIFHILHTGHSDEGRSPPVHCLELHVDEEAMGRALEQEKI